MPIPSLSPMLSALTDRTTQFVRDGYLFQSRLRASKGRPADDRCPVKFSVLGGPALLVRGKEGVELFYDNTRMKRDGAMPLAVRGPLFGEGAVHGLDDEEHRARKAMFVGIAYDDDQVRRLMPLLEARMKDMLEEWTTRSGNVYDDSVLVYGRAILEWAGIPREEPGHDVWAQRLGQIVEGFGHLGPEHVEAWVNRRRCNQWAADLVRRTRNGEITPPEGTALATVSAFRGPDGQLLDDKTAGVELQNATRPAIAVARFASFAARQLILNPQMRRRIGEEVAESGSLLENPYAVAFAQEVRRLSPFVPMLPAVARSGFTWQGERIEEGQRVVIDILGTNTDPQDWEDPQRFDPERFLGVDGESLPAFIPQGGGDVHTGHRCPGEKIAVTALSVTVSALSTPGVELDPGDVEFSWTRMLTRPRSGVRVRVQR